MSNGITRRALIERAGLAAGLGALGGVFSGVAAAQGKSPNEKLNIGCIAVGGQGGTEMANVADENIVAICDVDEERLNAAAEQHPKARKYVDFRKMLEECKEIDAVTVSTPDHTHAVASVMAMKLGKHVYCQKPLTHDIYEARVMRDVARKHKVVTQMGTQGHSFDSHARLVELIQSGAIGEVKEVHVWTDRPAGWWPQGVDRPTDSVTPPSHLHWDLWLGTAQARPYNPAYMPFKWRGWWDFGTGALGDMACHLMDPPFWALNLGYPTSVEAEGEPRKPDSAPLWSVIRYEFPKRGKLPPVRLTWYDGGKLPSTDLLDGVTLPKESNGSLFVGSEGKLIIEHGQKPRLLPEAKYAGYKGPDPFIPRSPGHYIQWIEACKTGKPTGSNFDYASVLTESVLLGNVAFRVGRKIEWDAKRMRAKNAPEASQYVRREYRSGWSL
jgi:predicted dehydrogenase